PRIPGEGEPLGLDNEPAAAGGEDTAVEGVLARVVNRGLLEDLAGLAGGPVDGQTGTAEWTDEEGELALHSWVIVAQGDLVIAVFVEDGSYGSVTAGPIAREVLEGV